MATKKKPEATPNPMTAFNPAAAAAWQEVMAESVRFMTDRLQKDMETQKALLACKSPADLMKVQTQFYEDALADYSAQASRVLALMSGKSRTKREYDDVPL